MVSEQRSSLVSEARVHAAGRFDQRVIEGDEALLVGGRGDLDVAEVGALHDDKSVAFAGVHESHGVVAKEGGQHAVSGHGRAAALDVPEDDVAALDAGA